MTETLRAEDAGRSALVARYMVKRFFRCCVECGESSRSAMLSMLHCTPFLFLAFRVYQWYIGHRSYTAQQQPCSSTCPPPTLLRTAITHAFDSRVVLACFSCLVCSRTFAARKKVVDRFSPSFAIRNTHGTLWRRWRQHSEEGLS